MFVDRRLPRGILREVGASSLHFFQFLRRGVSVERWLPVYLGNVFGDVYGGVFDGGLLEIPAVPVAW